MKIKKLALFTLSLLSVSLLAGCKNSTPEEPGGDTPGGDTPGGDEPIVAEKYMVTFKDDDGRELYKYEAEKGDTAMYAGETIKGVFGVQEGDLNIKVFAGWNNPLASVTADVTYTATYDTYSLPVAGTSHYYGSSLKIDEEGVMLHYNNIDAELQYEGIEQGETFPVVLFGDKNNNEYSVTLSGDDKYLIQVSVQTLDGPQVLGYFQPDVEEFKGSYNGMDDPDMMGPYNEYNNTLFLGNEFAADINSYRAGYKTGYYSLFEYRIQSYFKLDSEGHLYKAIDVMDYEDDYDYFNLRLDDESMNLFQISEEYGDSAAFFPDYSYFADGLYFDEDTIFEFDVDNDDPYKIYFEDSEYVAGFEHSYQGTVVNLTNQEERITIVPSSNGVKFIRGEDSWDCAVNLLAGDYFSDWEGITYSSDDLKVEFVTDLDWDTYDYLYNLYINDEMVEYTYGVYNGLKVIKTNYNDKDIYFNIYQNGICMEAVLEGESQYLVNREFFEEQFVGTYDYDYFENNNGFEQKKDVLKIDSGFEVSINEQSVESEFVYDVEHKSPYISIENGDNDLKLKFFSVEPKIVYLDDGNTTLANAKLYVAEDALEYYYNTFIDGSWNVLAYDGDSLKINGADAYFETTLLTSGTGYTLGFLIYHSSGLYFYLPSKTGAQYLFALDSETGELLDPTTFIPTSMVQKMIQKYYFEHSEYDEDYFELNNHGEFYVPVGNEETHVCAHEKRSFYFQIEPTTGVPMIYFEHVIGEEQVYIGIKVYDNYIRVGGQNENYVSELAHLAQGAYTFSDAASSYAVLIDGINMDVNGIPMTRTEFSLEDSKLIAKGYDGPSNYTVTFDVEFGDVSNPVLSGTVMVPPNPAQTISDIHLIKNDAFDKRTFLGKYIHDDHEYEMVLEYSELYGTETYVLKDENGTVVCSYASFAYRNGSCVLVGKYQRFTSTQTYVFSIINGERTFEIVE